MCSRPSFKGVTSDNYFLSVGATREDEAMATAAGAYMAGLRGAVMMQTSGFALIANALASLTVPYQIPTVMVKSLVVRTIAALSLRSRQVQRLRVKQHRQDRQRRWRRRQECRSA